MKLVHIETKYDGDITLPRTLLRQLPATVMLASTIQFREQLPSLAKQLNAAGKQVLLFRGVHDAAGGQVLGCDIFTSGRQFDAFLYVGDGLFHPTAFLYGNGQPVYYHNPFTGRTQKLTQRDMQAVQRRRTASLARFHAAAHIGILVSAKPGQNNLPAALELKQRLALQDTKASVFLSETLDIGQLANFPFDECWVNTACPRIIEDTKLPMVNLWDLRSTVMKGFAVRVV